MSRTRLIKRTAKMSANALKFITTFLSVGNIRTISPNKNDTNEIINNDAAMIVIVVII